MRSVGQNSNCQDPPSGAIHIDGLKSRGEEAILYADELLRTCVQMLRAREMHHDPSRVPIKCNDLHGP